MNARFSGRRQAVQPAAVLEVGYRDPSQSSRRNNTAPVKNDFQQTKLGNSSGRRSRVDQEQLPAPTGIPSMADVILSYFFKTIYTKKPLIDYTTSEKNRLRKWATAHSKYKALTEAFCEILFQFGDKGADLERGLSLYESSIVPLHDRGGRGTAVVKSRAYLKCLRAPRGNGNSITKFRSRVRASTIRSALDRLHAASAQCAARSGARRPD